MPKHSFFPHLHRESRKTNPKENRLKLLFNRIKVGLPIFANYRFAHRQTELTLKHSITIYGISKFDQTKTISHINKGNLTNKLVIHNGQIGRAHV